MTVDQILQVARDGTGTTLAQAPAASLVIWANIIYKKLIRRITTEVDENYFVVTYTDTAVASQSGYTLQTDVLKVTNVRIKPLTTYLTYIQSSEVDFSKMEFTRDYYELYQPTDQPIHQIIGQKLYICPLFTTDTTGAGSNAQIKYDYEQRQADLASGGAESTVKLPLDYHHVIAFGIKPYIFALLRKTNEKNDAVAEFQSEQNEMIANMSGRDDTYNALSTPDDSTLQ